MKYPNTLPWITMESLDDNDAPCTDICYENEEGFNFVSEVSDKDYAEYIVQAANLLPEMVELLERSEKMYSEYALLAQPHDKYNAGEWIGDIRELLNKVKS